MPAGAVSRVGGVADGNGGGGERETVGLTAPHLLVLQLAARGYTLRQIAWLSTQGSEALAGELLRQAALALGVPDAATATGEARRRGLIG